MNPEQVIARIDELMSDSSLNATAKNAELKKLNTALEQFAATKSAAGRLSLPNGMTMADLARSSDNPGAFETGGLRTGRKGASASPLAFAPDDVRGLYEAATKRSTAAIRAKAFSTVTPNVPAEYAPGLLGPVHENRLLDRLPTLAIGAPSYEYIRHSSTTGGPGVVAEGAAKPEATAGISTLIATVVKIAVHSAVSWETLRDYSAFESYWLNELTQQIIDAETAQILAGSGTGGNLTGLVNTSGILTHAVDTANNETALDAIESSIAALRTGAALATADLLIVNPSDWSKIRRTKDTQGNYILSADPTAAEARSVWGIEVLPTTAQAAGTAVMLDTTKFGRVLVRDGLEVQTGSSGDDFTRNLTRFVVEERVALAVERPAAVLKVTGL